MTSSSNSMSPFAVLWLSIVAHYHWLLSQCWISNHSAAEFIFHILWLSVQLLIMWLAACHALTVIDVWFGVTIHFYFYAWLQFCFPPPPSSVRGSMACASYESYSLNTLRSQFVSYLGSISIGALLLAVLAHRFYFLFVLFTCCICHRMATSLAVVCR
jgi:hypothetical protein